MTHHKKLLLTGCISLITILLTAFSFAIPSVYPTGTTIYDPGKTWNGYTIFDTPEGQGSVLIDMNGNVVKVWKDITAVPSPSRILPGGYILGGDKGHLPHLETVALIQQDWDGNEVWRFDQVEQVETQDGETVWASRQHHDWQREGNPVGYYTPDSSMEPQNLSGRTLVLSHKDIAVPEISDKLLEDDYILELSWDGEVLWEWLASDHVDEFGFSEEALNVIYRSVTFNEARGSAEWLHINAMSYVGPNQWYEGGDQRFDPENILISSREASFIAIINREGNVVWRMGPDYRSSEALSELGQIIGQHHPHIIPKGLPGAGNLLVFDNGGASGYGYINPATPNGVNSMTRDSSRVLEINPVTFEKVWEYSIGGLEHMRFYSWYVSAAQRLPNGNTMITEGGDGRIFEVTTDNEIVWEYVSPYFEEERPTRNAMFRATRLPYDWVPQLQAPVERAVVPPNMREFRISPQ